jgi:hypothetical protein
MKPTHPLVHPDDNKMQDADTEPAIQSNSSHRLYPCGCTVALCTRIPPNIAAIATGSLLVLLLFSLFTTCFGSYGPSSGETQLRHLHIRVLHHMSEKKTKTKKLHGLSPRANYTDRATAACREVIANFCE